MVVISLPFNDDDRLSEFFQCIRHSAKLDKQNQ